MFHFSSNSTNKAKTVLAYKDFRTLKIANPSVYNGFTCISPRYGYYLNNITETGGLGDPTMGVLVLGGKAHHYKTGSEGAASTPEKLVQVIGRL